MGYTIINKGFDGLVAIYDITLTRGDTLLADVTMIRDKEPYTPEAGSVRFAMKRRYTDDEPAVVRDIPIDTMVLEIKPEDTKELCMDKSYVYDIQFTDENGRVDTFIKGNVTLTNEVL